MRRFLIALTIAASVSPALAATAFLVHETVSGQNKICYYRFLSSTYTLNVRAYQRCPYSIKV